MILWDYFFGQDSLKIGKEGVTQIRESTHGRMDGHCRSRSATSMNKRNIARSELLRTQRVLRPRGQIKLADLEGAPRSGTPAEAAVPFPVLAPGGSAAVKGPSV